MESTTTRSKSPSPIKATIFSAQISSVTMKFWPNLLEDLLPDNLRSLEFNCPGDSSPQTYKIFLSENFWTICINKVDLPIPGSPLIKTTSPGISPAPSTLSTSLYPVEIRESRCPLSDLCSAIEEYFAAEAFLAPEPSATTSSDSSNVPHCPQFGHLPDHLRNSPPQEVQIYLIQLLFIYNLHSTINHIQVDSFNLLLPYLVY